LKKKYVNGKITIRPNGPYKVEGNIPLVRKSQIVSEHGEPLNWKVDGDIQAESPYFLCRCGGSQNKPFCDSTHKQNGFDGTETARIDTFADRQKVDERGIGIVVKSDHSLCMNSGFCGNRKTNIRRMVPHTEEPAVRAEIMAMIDRCPSGTYSYSLTREGEDIEADLPVQVADTIEVISEGPIQGPLWVTGHIEIERSDQQPMEVRNRVTLCNCGESCNKPLCDGTHRRIQEEKLKVEKNV
jgi:CDGSH-type Zn-finger protein